MTAITVDSANFCSSGYVRVEWSHTANPDHYSYRVYGRNVGEPTWTLLYQITDTQAVYLFDDYLAASNTLQEYAVVQVTAVGSVQTEEAKDPEEATPLCDHYWLLYQGNHALDVRLEHVTSDSFSEEYEEEIMKLIGRGRKADRGTNFGVVGSLSADIRDMGGLTAFEQQARLRSLREMNTYVYLRNPFGDVWQVVLGQLDFSRVPGVGISPWATVTIPYTEVMSSEAQRASEATDSFYITSDGYVAINTGSDPYVTI